MRTVRHRNGSFECQPSARTELDDRHWLSPWPIARDAPRWRSVAAHLCGANQVIFELSAIARRSAPGVA